jgi:hypothetical protein
MKKFGHFLRTTVVGGIFFLVPIIVLIIVLNKALAIAHKLVDPIAARLPFESLTVSAHPTRWRSHCS